jgi:hypothetical protein
MKYFLSLIISGALVVSGFGQTRNVLVGTNNAVVQPTNFWSADAVNARSGLGLGTAATNPASAFQPSSLVLSNLASSNAVNLTNLRATNIIGVIPTSNISSLSLTNISGTLAISSGGTGATNASNARTALGLGTAATNEASAFQPASTNLTNLALNNGENLTNVPASSVKGVLSLSNGSSTNLTITIGSTNRGLYATDGPPRVVFVVDGVNSLQVFSNSVETATGIALSVSGAGSFGTNLQIGGPLSFSGTNAAGNATATRTNLGLGWPALTNSNAGTGLVSVSTNGEVVSPTNFWQVAPIVTRFVESQPTTNQTTNITAARNLHIHSLAISTVGVTNTIALPTTNSFDGDIALVVHQGPTSSVTAVRTAGAGTNLVTLNQFDEVVEFVYYNNVWQFNHNRSFIEPIYFSGTNAAANAAASRTNLGLGVGQTVEFNELQFLTLVETNYNNYLKYGSSGIFSYTTDGGGFLSKLIDFDSDPFDQNSQEVIFYAPIRFTTNSANLAGSQTNNPAGITRTNLGLGATNNVTFSNVVTSGTLTATSTVTAKTNLVVEGFVDYTAARTNNTPTNTPNFAAHAAWIEVKVGTNSFFLPAYQ